MPFRGSAYILWTNNTTAKTQNDLYYVKTFLIILVRDCEGKPFLKKSQITLNKNINEQVISVGISHHHQIWEGQYILDLCSALTTNRLKIFFFRIIYSSVSSKNTIHTKFEGRCCSALSMLCSLILSTWMLPDPFSLVSPVPYPFPSRFLFFHFSYSSLFLIYYLFFLLLMFFENNLRFIAFMYT